MYLINCVLLSPRVLTMYCVPVCSVVLSLISCVNSYVLQCVLLCSYVFMCICVCFYVFLCVPCSVLCCVVVCLCMFCYVLMCMCDRS